jgi:two-component system KDP operon response regulator KdpE
LILRVKAVLRRAELAQPSTPVRYADGILQVDQARNLVTKRGQPVRLSAKEMDLLTMLVERVDEIIPSNELLAALWPDTSLRSRNRLKVLVSGLRRKIEDDPRTPQYVINRRGVGYGFRSRTPPQ